MVLLHGELYEEYVMQNIIPLLQMIIESDSKKNDVILLDIGANTDAWTIGLADKFDAPTLIYAFDPFREYLDCLEYSLQLNEFSSTNFVLMDMVISNENYLKHQKTIVLPGRRILSLDFDRSSSKTTLIPSLSEVEMIYI
jgi:FkbM family methyltransferase